MAVPSRTLRDIIEEAIVEATKHKAGLQEEQDASQDDYDAWEDSGETDGEPECIDNDDAINGMTQCLNFLNKALDELDD